MKRNAAKPRHLVERSDLIGITDQREESACPNEQRQQKSCPSSPPEARTFEQERQADRHETNSGHLRHPAQMKRMRISKIMKKELVDSRLPPEQILAQRDQSDPSDERPAGKPHDSVPVGQ